MKLSKDGKGPHLKHEGSLKQQMQAYETQKKLPHEGGGEVLRKKMNQFSKPMLLPERRWWKTGSQVISRRKSGNQIGGATLDEQITSGVVRSEDCEVTSSGVSSVNCTDASSQAVVRVTTPDDVTEEADTAPTAPAPDTPSRKTHLRNMESSRSIRTICISRDEQRC